MSSSDLVEGGDVARGWSLTSLSGWMPTSSSGWIEGTDAARGWAPTTSSGWMASGVAAEGSMSTSFLGWIEDEDAARSSISVSSSDWVEGGGEGSRTSSGRFNPEAPKELISKNHNIENHTGQHVPCHLMTDLLVCQQSFLVKDYKL